MGIILIYMWVRYNPLIYVCTPRSLHLYYYLGQPMRVSLQTIKFLCVNVNVNGVKIFEFQLGVPIHESYRWMSIDWIFIYIIYYAYLQRGKNRTCNA